MPRIHSHLDDDSEHLPLDFARWSDARLSQELPGLKPIPRFDVARLRDLLQHLDRLAFVTAFQAVPGPLKQGGGRGPRPGGYFVKRLIAKKKLGGGRRRRAIFGHAPAPRSLDRDLDTAETKGSANVLDDPFTSCLVDYISRVRGIPSFDGRRVNDQRSGTHEIFRVHLQTPRALDVSNVLRSEHLNREPFIAFNDIDSWSEKHSGPTRVRRGTQSWSHSCSTRAPWIRPSSRCYPALRRSRRGTCAPYLRLPP